MSESGADGSTEQRGSFPDGLARARPAAVGIDARVLEQFLARLAAEGIDWHSFLLHRRGHLACELYRWPYGAHRPRLMHSVAKSFTACAVGLALAERRFALTDKVVDFFPRYLPDSPGDNLAAMTVEDLLTMQTGHAQETSGTRWRGLQSSWIREFFDIPVIHRPGTVYQYTSAASYMLSAIVTEVTGRTLHEYLRPRLFEPLGIHGETWDLGPDGINPGGNGLTCKSVDVLKLGILHAQRGLWNGRRLLTEEWVADATRAHSARGYGYHWMSGPDHTFCAMGVFGQLLVVFPDQGASIVLTAAVNSAQACTRCLLPLIHEYFPKAFADGSDDTRAAEDRLLERARRASLSPSLISCARPAPGYSGTHEYRIENNALGVISLRLSLSDDRCALHLTDADGEHVIETGIGQWIEGDTDMPGRELHHGYDMRPARVVAGARWLDADTLEMSWILVESAFRDTAVLRFSGSDLTFSRRVNVNTGPLCQPPLRGQRLSA
jgi:CubicO group peptidase (beta-lactamase class C family)